jgi:putative amide transporter protein
VSARGQGAGARERFPMASVGLLYVGAVLVVNGLMLLGYVDARAAAPMNLFVGGLQVITPTYLIFTAGGDQDAILFASGIYLFGFTYLYVGFNLLAGLDGTGLGWFSAFVACCAVVYSGLNFGRFDDPAFGVIWLIWAGLWGLFFLVLGLGRESLTRFTGAVAVVAGVLTCAGPAFLLLTGEWAEYTTTWAIVIGVATVIICGALFPRLRGPLPADAVAEPELPATSTGVPGPRDSRSETPSEVPSETPRRS